MLFIYSSMSVRWPVSDKSINCSRQRLEPPQKLKSDQIGFCVGPSSPHIKLIPASCLASIKGCEVIREDTGVEYSRGLSCGILSDSLMIVQQPRREVCLECLSPPFNGPGSYCVRKDLRGYLCERAHRVCINAQPLSIHTDKHRQTHTHAHTHTHTQVWVH